MKFYITCWITFIFFHFNYSAAQDEWTCFSEEEGYSRKASAIFEYDGEIWLATNKGLLCYSDEEWIAYEKNMLD